MNDVDKWSNDLELARAAALAAGEVVMRYFGHLDSVSYKSGDQPVTEADLEADRLLRQTLLAARPDYGWLSEETADSAARLERRRVWIVDPIDGTNSFVAGIPEFAVSVGLVEDGRPIVGVIHNPATGEVYQASRGGGAYRGEERIRVARAPATGEPWRLLASRTDISRGRIEAAAPSWDVLPVGSTAYRMVRVADGTAHAYVSNGVKQEWDICAAAIILNEAGGVVGLGNGEPVTFNRPSPRVNGLIAACGWRLPPPLDRWSAPSYAEPPLEEERR